MNWSALAVPAITVDKELDAPSPADQSYEPRSFSDEYNHNSYSELFEEFIGMPVGVQLVTGRLEEEKAVGIARMLEQLSKK